MFFFLFFNPVFGRHWIAQPMQKLASILNRKKKSFFFLQFKKILGREFWSFGVSKISIFQVSMFPSGREGGRTNERPRSRSSNLRSNERTPKKLHMMAQTEGRTRRLYDWIGQVGPIQWKYLILKVIFFFSTPLYHLSPAGSNQANK